MTAYVAFLRGINLGPANRVPMAELRQLAEELGYGGVGTYINSGNLVLTSTDSAADVADALQQALADRFGLRIDVAVRSREQLRTILDGNPYPDGNPSQVTLALLTGPAAADAADRVAAVATEQEPYTFAGTEIWVNYTGGQANSKLSLAFSKIIGVSATVRNVRTAGRVLEMLERS